MKIQTGAPEGSPSTLLLCSPMALLSKNPEGVTGGWYGHGTAPSSSPQPRPSVPLGAFSKPHFPAAPKSPHAPSQRQVASSPPASAPLSPHPCRSSLWAPASRTWKSTTGSTGSRPLFHPQTPDKIFPNSLSLLPLAPLQLCAAASACPTVHLAPSMAKHSRPRAGQQVS